MRFAVAAELGLFAESVRGALGGLARRRSSRVRLVVGRPRRQPRRPAACARLGRALGRPRPARCGGRGRDRARACGGASLPPRRGDARRAVRRRRSRPARRGKRAGCRTAARGRPDARADRRWACESRRSTGRAPSASSVVDGTATAGRCRPALAGVGDGDARRTWPGLPGARWTPTVAHARSREQFGAPIGALACRAGEARRRRASRATGSRCVAWGAASADPAGAAPWTSWPGRGVPRGR